MSPTLAELEAEAAPLRTLANLRSSPDSADWYCERCFCRKSQDRLEPNGWDDPCSHSECACHALAVECDYCGAADLDRNGTWLRETAPKGTPTIWACAACVRALDELRRAISDATDDAAMLLRLCDDAALPTGQIAEVAAGFRTVATFILTQSQKLTKETTP